MNRPRESRRAFLKSSLVATSAGFLSAPLMPAVASEGKTVVKVAGYDYDRAKGIIDGRAGIDQASVSFHYEDIYSVNALAFGNDKTYEVTELGLVPYVTKFVNEDFRDYVLIPVFISRVFRHRNVFVHA
ncbi:MAG: hypothetical protein OEV47_09570, partial [Gammaproteobacteria bacterium]|nr:hypothetical protein [Gammaproteobacteria bacterium]